MTVLIRGRRRFVLIATVLGMVAAILVIMSSTGASGQAPTTIEDDAGVILVGTGDGETWIRYYADPVAPLDVDADADYEEQTVSVSSKCVVTTDGSSLLAISQFGGSRGVGLVSNGYGVKDRNNCSTSQGRISLAQSLTFELGSFFGSDIQMVLGEVDIEGKHGADLAYSVTLLDDEHSDTVELPNTTDNGPDSGVGDNSLAVVAPPMNFTSITFSPDGSGNAEIAFEGGGDGVVPGGAERTALGVNQSLFKLVSVREFDAGDLDCGDVGVPPTAEEEGPAERIILGRGDNTKPGPCNEVAYTFRIETDSVLFDADLTSDDQENANFLIRIDWDPTVTPVDPANPPDRQINYFPFDDPDDYDTAVSCVRLLDEGDPDEGDIIDEDPDIDDLYEHPMGPTGDPAKFDGEIVPWCIAGEKLVLLGNGLWQHIQWYDGAGDPRFR